MSAPLVEYSQWRKDRCRYCASGMPMSLQPNTHWTGNASPPKCEAPSADELIATQAQALKEAEENKILEARKTLHALNAEHMINEELRAECDSLRSQLEAAQQEAMQGHRAMESLFGEELRGRNFDTKLSMAQQKLDKLVHPTEEKKRTHSVSAEEE